MKPLLRRIPLIGSVPALPLVTNSDAEAAYSLRKLTPSYSGSAVRIRRSSDDAEQDIGFNGLDFDIASAESFCGAGNGFITTWYDQSGNGNDATQATASNQPLIVSSGSVLTDANGKVIIRGDGIDDFLNTGNVSPPSTNPKISVFQKVKSLETVGASEYGATAIGPSVSSSGTRSVVNILNPDSTSECSVRLSGGNTVYSYNYTNLSILSVIYKGDGGEFDGYANGNSLTVNSSGVGDLDIKSNSGIVLFSGISGTQTYTSPNTQLNCELSEVIIYFSDKSSRRSVIENDMNRYYGVF